MKTKLSYCYAASTLTLALLAVPALAQNAQQAPNPEQTGAVELEEIVVTGIRASLSSSFEIKRQSDAIVDAVVSEDIGKLPDNNVSEALARVTGIQVTRYQDEARGVLIRGFSVAATTFGGREIFTAEGRSVALQDFPAAMVAGLEVNKTVTPDLIEGGVTGSINVRAHRPFDFNERTISVGVKAGYSDLAKDIDPNFNVLASNRWDTSIGEIGFLLSGTLTTQSFLNTARWNDPNLAQPGDPDGATGPEDPQVVSPTSVGRDIYYPGLVGQFTTGGKRERPAFNAAMQWAPSNRVEVTADFFYQSYHQEDTNDMIYHQLSSRDGNPDLTNVVVYEDDPTKVKSLTKEGGRRPEMYRGLPTSDVDTLQAGLGAKYDGDIYKMSTDFAYTYSKRKYTDYGYDLMTAENPDVDIVFDQPEYEGSYFLIKDYDMTDPENIRFRGLYDRLDQSKGDGIQWRADVSRDFEESPIGNIQLGVRYTDRSAIFDGGDRYAWFGDQDIRISETPIGNDGELSQNGLRDKDSQGSAVWYTPKRDAIYDNMPALRAYARAKLEEIGRPAGEYSRWDSALPEFNPTRHFEADEKVLAGYARAKYNFDLGLPVDGLVGVRVVQTKTNLQGNSDENGQVEEINQDSKYTDVLPTATMRLKFTPETQMRLAFAKSRTRPEFNQLNPARVVSPYNISNTTTTYVISSGNIDLKPVDSTNFDATFEYYPSETSSLTVAGFYYRTKNFINNYTTENVIDPEYGEVDITRPENAGKGKIIGVEVAYTTFFDMLPGWLSGFGTQVNYTKIFKAEQELPLTLDSAEVTKGKFLGVSDDSFNVNLFYEKHGVSARLAYNYRSDWIDSYGNLANDGGRYAAYTTDAISRLDFSGSYDFTKWLTVTFDATNLLGTPFRNVRTYADQDITYTHDIRYESRVYSLGARMKF